MKIFCHRGKFGCTDIRTEYLILPYVKGENLKNFPPENSHESIKAAFDAGYNVEIDVLMTKDKHVIVSHTNYLPLHAKNAKENDFVSNMNLADVLKLKTGMAGTTAKFMTYDEFISLFKQYESVKANIEIKGTIMPQNSFPEPQNPSLTDKLVELTPANLLNRIIWSSFALSNLVKMRDRLSNANVAQLFAEPQPSQNPVYPDTDDLYMQFNVKNLKAVWKQVQDIDAVHPSIDSLNDEAVEFCIDNGITIRTWALWERNPLKSDYAKMQILNALKYKKQYPSLELDFITDFADEVKKLIEENK